ncbi:S9 family peptidase [Robertkochia marina]|uniref:Proline-specific endopeptidase n=1 Tax=Robertkochia marina TaxID=1227945 RepID=A0A4S3M2U9_9FLAO|nr:S9 family peptidase [Robertkochia marina]THD67815.1 S9 family peptidase [Robertkochia marina]TRZ41711.1 S9 family peptidase [Robertkochia marina]
MKVLNAPVAAKKPKKLEIHDDVRIDEYYWLRERENEEVIDYLKSENDYYDNQTRHTDALKESLFQEMRSRIKEDDESVPYRYNGYWYITRFEEGKDYPLYYRKADQEGAVEELLFDCNGMAEGHSYFHLRGINISKDNRKVAFGIDTVGRRIYTIYVKDLQTGELHQNTIENTTGSSVWANDNETLFYSRKDEVTLRSEKIYRHVMGSDPQEDVLVYHEEDETFNAFVYKSKSQRFIIFGSESTLTSEYSILDANNPQGTPHVFQPRIRGMEYGISHYGNDFYILTNADGAANFKLMKTSVDKTSKEHWEEVIGHREDVLLEDIDIFDKYLVVSERKEGLNLIRIIKWEDHTEYYLPFDNETYTAFPSTNLDFNTVVLRYVYNSLTTPSSTIDFNMDTREKTVLKEQEVLGGNFDKDNYTSERIWVTADDGQKVPVSMVYRKGMKKDGNNPLLLYGYGSYGATIDPYFSTVRLSLLDRGFIYAIAHIRGGEYLGRKWYEQGKLLAKKNTFTDYIACSRHLISENYTSEKHLYAMGGSAGGLLMGVVINMAPELYHGVVTQVPFVDVVTTMLDTSIPLTTGEFDEWGNPQDPEFYDYIKSYSPYDNVKEQEYPHLLVTTGLHDSQVQYWEPAKWVARLRDRKKGDNKLLFHINMDAGHGGASGRFEALKEEAMEYAFLLDLEGISL